MSEKTTSITEAIQSGDKIPPSVYQMWIEDLIQEREMLIEAIKREKKSLSWGNAENACNNTIAVFEELLLKVGELP